VIRRHRRSQRSWPRRQLSRGLDLASAGAIEVDSVNASRPALPSGACPAAKDILATAVPMHPAARYMHRLEVIEP